MLGKESRLDTCAAILMPERTSPHAASIKLSTFNVNTILADLAAAEPNEGECVCVCYKRHCVYPTWMMSEQLENT